MKNTENIIKVDEGTFTIERENENWVQVKYKVGGREVFASVNREHWVSLNHFVANL